MRFDRTLTIGRLNLFLHPHELTTLRREWLTALSATEQGPLAGYRFGDYCDEFLRECLGVTSLTMLDNSTYEGATYVHDMNQPLPSDLVEQFDVVIEAGSLEHVFNFPVAAANLMNSLKVGGTLFSTVPANNLCGHGFYQFSPELMFRVFSRENGFQLRNLSLIEAQFPAVESTPAVSVHQVTDPAAIGRRGVLRSHRHIFFE
jgi:SAM-dependent methyltransferase